MNYTVKKLARLAGTTPRTLHYYDQIGLLAPAAVGENGYRYYDEAAMLRLQQILFYRELGLSLEQIKALLNRPDFDVQQALQSHRAALQERMARLTRLISTVDNTLRYLQGEQDMQSQDFYAGFDESQQEEYAQQAEQLWGPTAAESQQRWRGYSRDQKNDILAQMHAITDGMAAAMEQEQGPVSPAAQEWVQRWHRHINEYFYPCSLEVFAALAEMYTQDARFEASFENVRPGLAAFMQQAMQHYCRITK